MLRMTLPLVLFALLAFQPVLGAPAKGQTPTVRRAAKHSQSDLSMSIETTSDGTVIDDMIDTDKDSPLALGVPAEGKTPELTQSAKPSSPASHVSVEAKADGAVVDNMIATDEDGMVVDSSEAPRKLMRPSQRIQGQTIEPEKTWRSSDTIAKMSDDKTDDPAVTGNSNEPTKKSSMLEDQECSETEIGTSTCLDGFETITDEAMCEEAGESFPIQKTWKGTGSWAHIQPGCVSRSNGNLWFNYNTAADTTHKDFSSVCQKATLWTETMAGRVCINCDRLKVASQQECQTRCGRQCPGYAYITNRRNAGFCWVCKDLILQRPARDMSFFANPHHNAPTRHFITCGRRGQCGPAPRTLTSNSEKHDVRCCNGIPFHYTPVQGFAQAADVNWCPEVETRCESAKTLTYDEAFAFCNDRGGRLCTAGEAEGVAFRGEDCLLEPKDCDHHSHMIWTSDTQACTDKPRNVIGLCAQNVPRFCHTAYYMSQCPSACGLCPDYVETEYGDSACPDGYGKITDKEVCKEAGDSLQKTSFRFGSWAHIQSGCISKSNNKIWFNANTANVTHHGFSSVCKHA